MSIPALSFDEAGRGIPVVLLHAFCTDRTMWDEVRDSLTDSAYVIRIDAPGFGASPLPATGTSLAEVADGVVAVVDGLDVDRFVLAGLSMGGYIALEVLARHSERLAGLGLINTRAEADDAEGKAKRAVVAERALTEGSMAAVSAVWEQWLSPNARAEARYRDQVVAGIERSEPAAVAWASLAMAQRADHVQTLREHRLPAVVVVGDQDGVTPVASAQVMADALNTDVTVLQGVGHLSAVEAPEAVARAIGGLIKAGS